MRKKRQSITKKRGPNEEQIIKEKETKRIEKQRERENYFRKRKNRTR